MGFVEERPGGDSLSAVLADPLYVMKKKTEEELIDLALVGDQRAWDEIYRRFYSRVRRIVSWGKWGFRYAEVDEIVQEVFMELMKALPNFRREASLSTFLTRLSKNKCISVLRRKGAQKRAREEYGFVFEDRRAEDNERKIYAESKRGDPERTLLFGEEAVQLMDAMQYLSADCREVIRRRYFEDLSYKEICHELNLPLGTVCSRLKRCLMRLKEIYSEKFVKS